MKGIEKFFLIILIPVVIAILFGFGYLVRGIVFKEKDVKNSFSSIILSIVVGAIAITILGTALKGCNGEDESEQIWKRD